MATAPKSTDSEIQRKISQDQLASITSFADAAAVLREVHGTDILRAADELGDGFTLVDKSTLVGKPLILVDWKLMEDGDYGEPWVIVRAVVDRTVDPKVVFVDGSTGVRDQLIAFSAKHGYNGNLFAENGLRVSEYDYTDPDTKKVTPAKTYYVD